MDIVHSRKVRDSERKNVGVNERDDSYECDEAHALLLLSTRAFLQRRPRVVIAAHSRSVRSAPSLIPPLFVQRGDVLERVSDELLLQCARQLVAERFRPNAPVLKGPQPVRDFLKFTIGTRDHEVFALILLNTHRRLIDYVELVHGTVDGVKVNTHHVLECVITQNASAVILVHNHPSGNSQPSPADLHLTARLKKVLALIDVPVLDHLIVGMTITSLAETGQLQ